jgi:hypothetical protein
VVKQIKEKYCSISKDGSKVNKKAEKYTLPDGQEVEFHNN